MSNLSYYSSKYHGNSASCGHYVRKLPTQRFSNHLIRFSPFIKITIWWLVEYFQFSKFWQVSAQPGPVITLQSLCLKVAVSSCCVASSFLDYYQKVSSTVAEHKAMYHHRQGLIFCTSICFTIAVADPRHATSCAQGRASCHSEVNYCHSFSSCHICIISHLLVHVCKFSSPSFWNEVKSFHW